MFARVDVGPFFAPADVRAVDPADLPEDPALASDYRLDAPGELPDVP